MKWLWRAWDWGKRHRRIRALLIAAGALCVAGVIFITGVNVYVVLSARRHIATAMESAPHSQAAIVFGAGVYPGGALSPILQDRVQTGIDLYKAGRVKKLLLSGDHGRVTYNEVDAMRDFALREGVPAQDIFMDHAGFSTYDTLARAKRVFKVESAVLVTQNFHLPRALLIARSFGIEATGVPADKRLYRARYYLAARELAARVKDYVKVQFQPAPRFLGPEIPITGDGRLTAPAESRHKDLKDAKNAEAG